MKVLKDFSVVQVHLYANINSKPTEGGDGAGLTLFVINLAG